MNPEIIRLHAAYVKGTGLELRLDHARECVWGYWMAAGFTMQDLLLVIGYIRKGISKGERNLGALRFRNMIGMIDYFEEDLAMAKKALTARARPASREEAVTRLIDGGNTVTRLECREPAAEAPPQVASDAVKQTMEEFRRQMGRPRKKAEG
jgi:hypothetical protein